MGDGSHVLDQGDFQAGSLQRTDSGLTASAGALDVNFNSLHAVLDRSLSCGLGSGLSCERGALAYNVGCGKVMKSWMYAKMRSGNRNIYRDYVDFKRWNGKIVPSIERRRKMEYLLLFTP